MKKRIKRKVATKELILREKIEALKYNKEYVEELLQNAIRLKRICLTDLQQQFSRVKNKKDKLVEQASLCHNIYTLQVQLLTLENFKKAWKNFGVKNWRRFYE